MSKIPDAEIPKADPETLIKQYRPFVFKLAGKYKIMLEQVNSIDFDDLLQVGCIALLTAQKTYQPEDGKSFLGWCAFYVKTAMRRELGLKQDGTLPAPLLSLNEPINPEDAEGETRLNNLQDPNGQTPEEKAVEDSAREEVRQEVRAAVDRLKDDKQRQIIRKVYLEGKGKKEVAAALGISIKALQTSDLKARKKLYDDIQLQQIVLPSFGVGVGSFKHTMSSMVERAILWREKQFDQMFGDGAFAELIRKKAVNE